MVKKEERLVEWVACEWNVLEGKRDESDFYTSPIPVEYKKLATIKMLRDDLEKQLAEIESKNHPAGFFIPLGFGTNEVFITQDGAFIWDERIEDYRQVLIVNIYEKEWHDETAVIEEMRYRKNYFAVTFYR